MLIRFPLDLPPVRHRRRHDPRWRALTGFVALVLIILFLIYGFGPALEYWQEQAVIEQAQETR